MEIRRTTLPAWLLVAAVGLLSSCSTPAIFNGATFPDKPGVNALSIDAKQRIVLVTHVPIWHRGAIVGYQMVTCAEPSPDAMSALNTSISGSISDPKIAASLALAQAESAASIGLRTQSIQLLRDGMYRLCEGYAAGAISAENFTEEQRRYQNLMLSLLAIEQLTGAVVARQAAVGGGTGSAAAGNQADQAASDLAKADSDVADAKTALDKAQAAQTDDVNACNAKDANSSTACSKAADDQAAVDGAKTTLDDVTQKQQTAQAAMNAARSSVQAQAGGSQTTFSGGPQTNQMTDASAQYIAEATRAIVATTLLASFAQEDCTREWEFLSNLKPVQLQEFYGHAESGTGLAEVQHLGMNCQANAKRLFDDAALFEPQYLPHPAHPLQLLGGGTEISVQPNSGPISFFVVGGSPPYQVNSVPPGLSNFVKWTLNADRANFSLDVERTSGDEAEHDTAIYVVDAKNDFLKIPVYLTKASTAAK